MLYFKLHLIRHGLTQGNLDGRYIGSGTDLPLCEEGRAQLAQLKARFAYPAAEVVFTSPLLRATQTAELLYPGVRTLPLQDLREMAFGVFENRPITELAADPAFAAWMDPASQTVRVDGQCVSLTLREYDILKLLLENQGRVVSRETLLDCVWGYSHVGDDKVINTHIKNIRKKLGVDCIETIRGAGYKIEKEV